MIRISRSGYFVAEKESGFQVEGQINEETLEYLYNLIESSVSADEVASELITANATEEQALSLKEYYPVWRVGMEMEPGKIYRHDTEDGIRLFKVIAAQPFTAEAHFPPETTLTLYRDLESHIPPDGQEYPVWKQPTDEHDAYKMGDVVWFPEMDTTLYEVVATDGAGNNVWPPNEYGWKVFEQ